jgi:ribulose kinase
VEPQIKAHYASLYNEWKKTRSSFKQYIQLMAPYFIGIDIGTQGARVVLIDAKGSVISSKSRFFRLNDQSREEQSPLEWWDACYQSLSELLQSDAAKTFKTI